MTDFNQKTHDTNVGSHGGQSRQMMEVFENQKFGSIRVLQEAGKTFFCASDVAKALEYVNPYAAVKRHCRGPLFADGNVEFIEIKNMGHASISIKVYDETTDRYKEDETVWKSTGIAVYNRKIH